MAENNQKPAHSFVRFFGISIAEGWTESREKFGLAVDIGLVLAVFGILGLTWYSKHHGDFNEQGCLLELQTRLYEAKQISRYEFVDDLRKKEWESTNLIFNAIDRHLDVLLTSAEVAFFRDARPSPPPPPESYDMFTEREQEWLWHINFITVRKDELKKILERLG